MQNDIRQQIKERIVATDAKQKIADNEARSVSEEEEVTKKFIESLSSQEIAQVSSQIAEEIKQNEDIILFIDEVHTLIGAGAAEGAIDAANILKPALARGELQV